MKWVLAVCLVLLPALASAQTHPCDGAAPPTSGTVTAGALTVTWCHNQRDINGTTTTVSSWALYANTTRTGLTNVTTNGVANAAGLVLYRATVTFTQGQYNVSVVGLNGSGEGPSSSPFALNVQNPIPAEAVPSAPTRTVVTS